jgi:hypothetical protein
MAWDEISWGRHLRNVRGALTKRDFLLRAEGARPSPPGRRSETWRECRAWSATAKANLRRLASLAREAPDGRKARETVTRLERWYKEPDLFPN